MKTLANNSWPVWALPKLALPKPKPALVKEFLRIAWWLLIKNPGPERPQISEVRALGL